MAQNVKRLVDEVRDSTSNFVPDIKAGNTTAASHVLNKLGVKGTPTAVANVARHIMPDVTGMGARDAVYELERRGVKVVIHGRGKVKSQTVTAGKALKPGTTCELFLEI